MISSASNDCLHQQHIYKKHESIFQQKHDNDEQGYIQ